MRPSDGSQSKSECYKSGSVLTISRRQLCGFLTICYERFWRTVGTGVFTYQARAALAEREQETATAAG